MSTISITAAGLRQAIVVAREIAAVQNALDAPHAEQKNLAVEIIDTGVRVPVPWDMAVQYLTTRRAQLIEELAALGITLLPPDPVEAKHYPERL